jgi:hypothetical protein
MRTSTLAIIALLAFAAGPYGADSHRLAHRHDAGGGNCAGHPGGAGSFGGDGCAICKIPAHSTCEPPAPILEVVFACVCLPGAIPAAGEPAVPPGVVHGPRGPPPFRQV